MSDNRTNVMFRGIPTEPDVKRLEEAFGVPKVGDQISYESVAAILHEKIRSKRFTTVTNAWFARLARNHRLIVKAVLGTAFEIQDGHGITNMSSSAVKSALRKSGKAVKLAEIALTHELAPEDKRVAEHVRNVGAALRLAAATEAKRLPATV